MNLIFNIKEVIMMMSKVIEIDDLKRSINKLVEEKYPLIDEILLFGSYSRGDMDEVSDIDLFISKPDRVPAKYVYCMIGDLKRIYGKKVDLFRNNDVQKDSDIYKNIIEEGVIVYAGKDA